MAGALAACAMLKSAGGGGGGGGSPPPSGLATLHDETYYNTGTAPDSRIASLVLQSTGGAFGQLFAVGAWISYTWMNSGVGSDYEVRVTVLSGTLTSGTTGVWVSLGSSQSWYVLQAGAGMSEAVLSVTIRDVATQTTQDSATITVRSTVS